MKFIFFLCFSLLIFSNTFKENLFSENTAVITTVSYSFANSTFDQKIRNFYQNKIRNEKTDNFSKYAKIFGEGDLLIPLSLILSLSGNEWGKKTTQAYLYGAPTLLFSQVLTGGSRPTEDGSFWEPFTDDNGVSGHAFIGAVPFLVASNLVKNKEAKNFLILCSTFTAFSRINDDAHYFSQTLLGWWLAKVSVDSAFGFETKTFSPIATKDSIGFSFIILK